MLCVFACAQWCPTHIVLCFIFVLCCPFLIAPLIFSNIYLDTNFIRSELIFLFHFVFAGILPAVSGFGPVYSTALETELREELFTNNKYEVLQRPQQRVVIRIRLTILTVNDLVNKTQLSCLVCRAHFCSKPSPGVLNVWRLVMVSWLVSSQIDRMIEPRSVLIKDL